MGRVAVGPGEGRRLPDIEQVGGMFEAGLVISEGEFFREILDHVGWVGVAFIFYYNEDAVLVQFSVDSKVLCLFLTYLLNLPTRFVIDDFLSKLLSALDR